MTSLRAQSLKDILTFTRASAATYVAPSGLIASAEIDEPRIEYDPILRTLRGLLIEQARTNYLLRSQEFSNATWVKARATVTADAVAAPDGTVTADKLIEDSTATNSHHVYQQYTKGSSTEVQAYSASVWVKAAERTQFYLYCQGTSGSANSVGALFDLSVISATVGSPNGQFDNVAARIEAWPNGWYRCQLDFRVNNDGQAQVQVVCFTAVGGSNTYTGNGTSGLYLWGAQLERGAHASSYIPTTTATVGRSVDVCYTTQLAPWFNEEAGTMLVEYMVPNAYLATENGAGRYLFQFDDGTVNNRHVGYLYAGAPWIYSAASSVAQANVGSTPFTANTVLRMAYAWAENDCALAVTGPTLVTDSAALMPTGLTAFRLGVYEAAGNELDAYIRKARFYPRRLSDNELRALVG